MTPHKKTYPLGWVCDKEKLKVTRQCKLRFSFASAFVDEIELDIVPLDICGIVLGSPYLYDRKATLYRVENKYQLIKDGIEYIVRGHKLKNNYTLINSGKMKRIVDSCTQFLLIDVKENKPDKTNVFEGCNYKKQDDLEKVVSEYDILFQEPKGLIPKKEIVHDINLQQDARLPNIGMYMLSALENEKVKKQYPLPRIDDLLDQLKEVIYFSKLDLHSSYHQVRLVEEDAWKIAFKMKQGLYEWLVMPFCLTNAPATFMRVMNDVLKTFIDYFFIVYLDDILVFSKTWEEHLKHVKKTLDYLKRENIYVKLSKCEFGKTSFNYLGHIVGGGELKINPYKIVVIVNWSKPKSAIEVRSFVGATQYWRNFIANFSLIATPLHGLIGLKKVFQWGGKWQKAFNTLKEKIGTTPVLALPDLQRPFDIEMDASGYAMGAVLMQHGKPICYHSKTINFVVVNYPTYDKELYALVHCEKVETLPNGQRDSYTF
eukprot:PITA_21122